MSEGIKILPASPLGFIREHPDMYLPAGGLPLVAKLATLVTMDAFALGARSINLHREYDWCLISADIDWLHLDGCPDSSTLFERIFPLPEAGANSIRHEVVVNAFSLDVFTYVGGDVFVVRDSGASVDISALCELWGRQGVARGVAFRCGAD